MTLLRRKIDQCLIDWKKNPYHLPLIIKGARQIGKTESIRHFGKTQYKNYVEINFILQKQYRTVFEDGYEVDKIIQNITLRDPSLMFIPGETLIFFDELQACPDCATSLKSFHQDGRYDVICSGSLMGINYKDIESNSVGNKTDWNMYSMDFEEFLWAKGYRDEQILDMKNHLLSLKPFDKTVMDVMTQCFREYMVIGGMPAIVKRFAEQKNYSGILDMQKQIILDYEEDVVKYSEGIDRGKILNVYRSIPVFLGKENKKFMISKVAHGARNREYTGVVEWLESAGIINVCYCLERPELPLKGNYNPDYYKIYFGDPGLLIATMDEEAQEDLRYNQNFNAYKGAVYENVIAGQLVKQGYSLYFYRQDRPSLEMDFFVRDTDSLVPLEVKASDASSKSLNLLIDSGDFPDIRYGIKLCQNNIGYNGKFYTIPYFMAFALKQFIGLFHEEMK